MRCATLFFVVIASLGSRAGAQVITRRVGAVGAGQSGTDSVIVTASNRGIVSLVVTDARGMAPAVATATSVRIWVRKADSVARLVMPPRSGDRASFDSVALGAGHGGLSYSRTAAVGSATEHEIALAGDQGRRPVRIAFDDAQFDQILKLAARGAELTDSLSAAYRQSLRVLKPGVVRDDATGSIVGDLRGASVPGNDARTYFEYQVEKQARLVPRGAPPEYPAALRPEQIGGEVLAQFVVDTAGHVVMSTFHALKSPHALFTDAVKNVLPAMQFSPAEVGGVKVRQLVQMPFTFTPP